MPPVYVRLMRYLSRFALLLVLLTSAGASYIGLSSLLNARPMARLTGLPDDSAPPVNPFAADDGMHLIAFVFASSECGWSSRPETMRAVKGIREAMRAVFDSTYARVSVIAVSTDTDLNIGLRFLREVGGGDLNGAFDQIMVGGSWLNEQAIRFIWRERIAEAGVPQIVVIERPVITASYMVSSTIGVLGDRLRANPVGSTAIMQWVQSGFPLALSRDSAVGPQGRRTT